MSIRACEQDMLHDVAAARPFDKTLTKQPRSDVCPGAQFFHAPASLANWVKVRTQSAGEFAGILACLHPRLALGDLHLLDASFADVPKVS